MHFRSLTQLYASERQLQEKLPAPTRASRINLLGSFMSQRALLRLPDPDPSNFWRTCLYYKPDSAGDIEPFEWEAKPKDCFTKEQAHQKWLSKGCKFFDSCGSRSSVTVQDYMEISQAKTV